MNVYNADVSYLPLLQRKQLRDSCVIRGQFSFTWKEFFITRYYLLFSNEIWSVLRNPQSTYIAGILYFEMPALTDSISDSGSVLPSSRLNSAYTNRSTLTFYKDGLALNLTSLTSNDTGNYTIDWGTEFDFIQANSILFIYGELLSLSDLLLYIQSSNQEPHSLCIAFARLEIFLTICKYLNKIYSMLLLFIDKPSQPVISLTLGTSPITEGQSMSLTCQSVSTSQPAEYRTGMNYIWNWNGNRVLRNNNGSVSHDIRSVIGSISTLERQHNPPDRSSLIVRRCFEDQLRLLWTRIWSRVWSEFGLDSIGLLYVCKHLSSQWNCINPLMRELIHNISWKFVTNW